MVRDDSLTDDSGCAGSARLIPSGSKADLTRLWHVLDGEIAARGLGLVCIAIFATLLYCVATLLVRQLGPGMAGGSNIKELHVSQKARMLVIKKGKAKICG